MVTVNSISTMQHGDVFAFLCDSWGHFFLTDYQPRLSGAVDWFNGSKQWAQTMVGIKKRQQW